MSQNVPEKLPNDSFPLPDCKAIHPLVQDIIVIVALTLCLLVSGWLGLRLGRLLLPLVATERLGVYVGLVTFPLLSVVKGIFHFLCGYFLARWLRRINPWHIVGGLAVFVAVLAVLETPWSKLPQIAALSKTTVPILLVDDAVGPLFLLLFFSLGIYWQQRGSQKRDAAA